MTEKNRSRARFRHVREKLGDEAFKAELDKRFADQKAKKDWPDVTTGKADPNIRLLWRLRLAGGNIDLADALALADAGEPADAVLRINLEHGLELYGSKTVQLNEKLEAMESNPAIVACPGMTSCPRGLADTQETAEKLRKALAGSSKKDVRIKISGCPNNCVHSVVADIGLVGIRKTIDGESTQCYRVYTGGGNGINDTLAQASDVITADQTVETVCGLGDG